MFHSSIVLHNLGLHHTFLLDRCSGPLSSEGSLSCHTGCDKVRAQVFLVLSEGTPSFSHLMWRLDYNPDVHGSFQIKLNHLNEKLF